MEKTYGISNEVLLKGQQNLKNNIDFTKIKKILLISLGFLTIVGSLILFSDYKRYKIEGYDNVSLNRFAIIGVSVILIVVISAYYIILKALWRNAFNKYEANDVNIITSTENGCIYKQFRNDKEIYSVNISDCKIITSSKIDDMKIIIYMRYRRLPEYIIIPEEYYKD
ncbi:hypothetical protein [uncultured Clostridium sp.]|uniref:hypothetical protein n=1 Tax=uncultured Clostridium sp. TaxID=59620 RepID=UPI002622B140|nr:hypothetical protein [uncultured Clostridium sp.]